MRPKNPSFSAALSRFWRMSSLVIRVYAARNSSILGLLHHADVTAIEGESYRKRESELETAARRRRKSDARR